MNASLAKSSDACTISIVAARSLNNIIGNDDKIPWRVKGEQKLFKDLTMGGCMIMGRKTFETIGRPLPGRKTIIVTRNDSYTSDGCECASDIPTALTLARSKNTPIHIVGGGEIYRKALELDVVDIMHLTTIQAEVEGNVFFPEIPESEFTLVEKKEYHSNIDYVYECFQRIKI
jgi:dihydrofolate reductase (trimethoprim resistance protein)